MSQGINVFTELNSDSHPLNTKNNVMSDALNAALTTRGKNQLILQNLEGTHVKTTLTLNHQPLGVAVFNNISYILSGNFDANGKLLNGEIGTFPSPDYEALFANVDANNGKIDPNFFVPLKDEYQPLHNFEVTTDPAILADGANYRLPFKTVALNFAPNHLIEVELQTSYDESVNIIFTDDRNPIRLVNSRFKLDATGKKAALADRRQTRDTNVYSNVHFNYTRLIRQANSIPDLDFLGVDTGGIWEAGSYKFYFRYTDSDGALTDVIAESGLVSISYKNYGGKTGEILDKLIKFRFSNLDKAFTGIKVYYSKADGNTNLTTTVQEILNIYDLPTDAAVDTLDIILYGSELTDTITVGELNIDYSSINTVKTITQSDDRLVLGNVTNVYTEYNEIRDLCATIPILEDTELDFEIKASGSGYTDPNNIYFKLGYWSGELTS